ncbi:MAG: hypothetical protein CV088_00395 [Nitrospira sp. LK70]|nr:hypothetical protein [Nitrospira sp. LK70]
MDTRRLLSQLATDAWHAPLYHLRNDAVASLMLQTGLRTIEVSRARIEHLQEHVLSEKWKLWVHGKRRGSADESVQVL